MYAYQNGKQRLLRPLLIILDRCQVTPNAVTWFSAALGFAFIPVYLLSDDFWTLLLAHLLLFAHLVIDGIDGPLARHQGRASAAGSFTDTFADQLVIVATTIAYSVADRFDHQGMHPVTATTYAVLYCMAVGFAMVRNALRVPYRFLLRPRNFVYGLLMGSAFGWWGAWDDLFVEGGMWIFNVMLGISVATGFVMIRRSLAGNASRSADSQPPAPRSSASEL